jgi:SAM-dependent methyltransferase
MTNNRITLPAWRTIAYEVALNGWRILWETVNDFSLWRLIEYPWATRALDVRPGDLVVDIGSGTSSFPHMLAKEGVDVVIVELEADRVRWQRDKRRATARPGDGRFLPLVADATRLPFRDGSVRRISAVSSLEHIPDDGAVGREIGRALAEDGLVVLTLPFTSGERTSFFAGVRRFTQVGRNAFVQEGKAGSFFRFYTEDDIERVYIAPAHARVTERAAFGRSLLNGRYHETRLTRYWRKFVLKDWLLARVVHPLEERFDRSDPLYVMLALEKAPAADAQ